MVVSSVAVVNSVLTWNFFFNFPRGASWKCLGAPRRCFPAVALDRPV